MSDDTMLFQWVTAIGAIATPLLLLVLSGLGWYLKGRLEASWQSDADFRRRSEKLEESMRDDRLQVYNDILEPFIIILAKEDMVSLKGDKRKISKQEAAEKLIQSVSYRQAGFKLSLFANDDVVRAYNNLMQASYKMNQSLGIGTKQSSDGQNLGMVTAFGDFLLEIRRSVGNEKTLMTNLEMLTWMINDLDTVTKQVDRE